MNIKDVYYPINIHRIPEDGGFYYMAFHPDFGCLACSATGCTETEAIESLHLVRADVIAYYLESGKELPIPSKYPGESSKCLVTLDETAQEVLDKSYKEIKEMLANYR
jgi:predicted RNase H-like HicB family nuclease